MLKIIRSNEYTPNQNSLYAKTLNNDVIVKRLKVERKLKVHQGCVNTIVWNPTGEYILSGSDDLKLVITNPFNGRVAARIRSNHKRNIFQAKFLPESGNRKIISCAADGTLAFTQVEFPSLYGKCLFKCHKRTAYQVQTTPGDPNTFLSSSEDGTIRLFDIRESESCEEDDCSKHILLDCKSGVSSMDVDPVRSYYLAAASNDSMIRIFDRRMMKDYNNDVNKTSVRHYKVPNTGRSTCRTHTTCLVYDRYGAKLLANTTPKNLLELDCWSDKMEYFESPPPPVNNVPPTTDQPVVVPVLEKRNTRVRLRGDWTDTGPSSVLQAESDVDRELTQSERIFRDMSTALTNVLRSRTDAVSESDDSTDSPPEQEDVHISSTATSEDDKSEGHSTCPSMHQTRVYTGHRNQRTAIKQCSYWGDNLVVAGSDCGHIFLWRRDSGELLSVLEGDRRVVNCVQPHPYHTVLATSGIDYDIKLWRPISVEVDTIEQEEYIRKVITRNKKMLEEADDVVTLPARFIVPLLALIARRRQSEGGPAEENE